jgi:hypothetical protein
MIRKIIHAMATAAALTLLTAPALAGPMKCSGEQKTCVTTCQKTINPALQGQCIADCRSRLNFCRQTGCWDNGTSRYCGLLRQ